MQKYKVTYSPWGDVIYIELKPSRKKTGDMITDNIIVYEDDETGEIVGVEIIDFHSQYESGALFKDLKKYRFFDPKLFQEVYNQRL